MGGYFAEAARPPPPAAAAGWADAVLPPGKETHVDGVKCTSSY